jgi:hypothetical protein
MPEQAPQWEVALALALRLPIKERLQLAERLVASVETELPATPTNSQDAVVPVHWGKELLRVLDEVGPIELDHPEIDDPVEWVKQIRQDQERSIWGENE